ncbi:hypothetical protein [Actinoplanes sp. NPDC026670]|uniref:hypothetical protein n=1 Tax=Actinoplanes sp. NPDC026670 TaxID=3154700 RepID=UPI0034035403
MRITNTRVSRSMARMATVAMLATGGIGIAAAPAFAFPSGCSTPDIVEDGVKVGAYSRCTGGTGSHQITIACKGIAGVNWFTGPWKKVGSISSRECPLGTSLYSKFNTLSST